MTGGRIVAVNRRNALRWGVVAGAAATGLVNPSAAAARRHVLLDSAEHRLAVDRANAAAQLNNLVQVPEVAAPDAHSLAQYQTSFKNQGGRGTCYAFAACAAVEAAYKRKHGLELDLSEQFAFHVNKAGELYPDYMTTPVRHENNSSYWGEQGSCDLIDKLARAAIPAESLAPYLDSGPMENLRLANPACGALTWEATQEEVDAFEFLEGHVPLRSRHNAKYRVTKFAALPGNPTPSQVEAVIAGGYEVVADIPGHCILIVGYDRTKRVYYVKNSWGEGRLIEVSYDSTDWRLLSGRYVIDVESPNAAPQMDAFWVGRWQMDHDGWRGELVIRRTTDYRSTQGQPTKLGNYYRDGQRYDVNGVTAQNGQALHFWIADTTARVQPGAKRGQEFWAYVYGNDPGQAAGLTTWSGIPFGVSLSRSALPGRPTQGFTANDWIGAWAMNHDGWSGTLRITSVQPFVATYTRSSGENLPVSGGLDSTHPHVLRARIRFSGDNLQPFQLHAHTFGKDVFSGTTQWAGLTFGAKGRRI
ncbi:hypothetical protein DMH04_27175 [Kibdelosporangium aridum]|uniref:Peptidase C1A papain C-terminal domain-containing protein n=1 Tax=Kibdelosporangium aridum TaxID=2030 RepID=A0A428Z4L3_KIBAR|nr:hypothetical protein DMH04_27175 [Kibdelosporangium aridum]